MFAREYMHGRKTRIWLLCEAEDDSQPLDYIEQLSGPERDKVDALLKFTSNEGPPRNENKFKHLEGQVCEFKPYGMRLYCFQTNQGFVIARGHDKAKNKIEQREIEKARCLRKAFMDGGECYVEETEQA